MSAFSPFMQPLFIQSKYTQSLPLLCLICEVHSSLHADISQNVEALHKIQS